MFAVRRVFAKRDVRCVDERAHVGSRRLDERTHDHARARVHAAQAAGPGPAQQAQEERLGLIVPRVRDGDQARAQPSTAAREKLVPRRVRRLLDGDRAARAPAHRRRPAPRQAGGPSRPRAAAELLVRDPRPRRAADDSNAQRRRAETLELRDLAQHMQQRHRVGAAGHRHDHTGTRRNQSDVDEWCGGQIRECISSARGAMRCDGCGRCGGAKRGGARRSRR